MTWLTDRLVDDWKRAWRWASMQIHALLAMIIWVVIEYSSAVPALVKALPPEVQSHWTLRALAFFFTVALPLARLWKQKPKPAVPGKGDGDAAR